MAAWVCAECTTTYSVGAPRCPHCGSTEHTEEGAMPKITRHGGPSNAADQPPAPTEPEVVESSDGGEQSSVGNSSSRSAEKQPTSPEPSNLPRRRPARTTGSRSTKGRTDSSSAPSTDGDPAAGTSAADDEA